MRTRIVLGWFYVLAAAASDDRFTARELSSFLSSAAASLSLLSRDAQFRQDEAAAFMRETPSARWNRSAPATDRHLNFR